MLRILLTIFLIIGLVLAGCSKKEEEIKAIEEEATDTGAEAVMDSLEDTGMEAGEREGDTAAASKKTTTRKPQQPEMRDFSDLEGYVVQIGSYSTYDFAQMMAEKYQGRDYPAFVQATDIEGQTYYRLRVGVYETLNDAKQIAELLGDRYSAEYWIDYNR